MAEREAAIKLTLDDGQYVAAMGKAGDAAVKSAQRSERAMQMFGAGVDKASSNLKSLGATARSALGLVSGLLGGLTVGSALKGAVELDAKFKQLAFRVSTATREQVKHTDIQKLAEQAAAKTGRRTIEMADAYEQLFAATGDRDFTDNMLEQVGEAATATGQDISTLTSLADQLHTKFGVSADEMGDVFAQVFEAAQMGGPSFQEFADVASNMGAELLNAGLDGRRGLDFMLGSLVKTDDAMGNLQKQVKGVKQILLSLGDQAQITSIAKVLHIDPKKLLNEKDLMGRMRRILGMGKKGLDALKGSMKEAEEQKVLKILFTDPFEQALKEANDSGMKGKAAIDKALGVLDGQLAELGKSAINGSHLQKEAQDRLQDPQRRLEAALDQLQLAFGDPRIIGAIEDLSKYLPKIADVFGKFMQFAVKNPLLAGTLLVGGKAGSGFLEGILSEAITEAFTGGGDEGRRKGAGKMGGGGGGRKASAKDMAEGLADAVEDEIDEGGKRGASKLATVLRLAAVGAAAAFVYELGKEQIDRVFTDKAEATGNLAVVGAQASSMRGTNIEKHKADAEALRAAIAKARSEQGGFVSTLFGSMAHGAGADVDAMGNPIGTVDASRSGMPDLEGTMQKQIDENEALLAQKEALISKLESEQKAEQDVQANAKAIALAMKSGVPMPVNVQNLPTGSGAPPAKSGGGGSRGVKRPSAQAPGGGY